MFVQFHEIGHWCRKAIKITCRRKRKSDNNSKQVQLSLRAPWFRLKKCSRRYEAPSSVDSFVSVIHWHFFPFALNYCAATILFIIICIHLCIRNYADGVNDKQNGPVACSSSAAPITLTSVSPHMFVITCINTANIKKKQTFLWLPLMKCTPWSHGQTENYFAYHYDHSVLQQCEGWGERWRSFISKINWHYLRSMCTRHNQTPQTANQFAEVEIFRAFDL